MDKKYVTFHHGALADSYEKQANEQGYTLGKYAEVTDKAAFGLHFAWIHGCLTDKEHDRAIEKVQKKLIVPHLKEVEE